MIDTDGDTAKFSVDTNEKAADIIAALSAAGLRVFKSSFEKRELVDLFLSAPSVESGGAQ